MACSYDQDYEKGCFSIREIIGSERFPIVAQTQMTNSCTNVVDQFGIPENTELLVQRHFKARYARIKVLDFHDSEKVQNEKGPEFVLKHNSYVGKEFLLPLKYSGMFKFVQRPGTRGTYSSISQVLSDPPALLRVCDDTEALDVKNLDRTVIVPAQTLLQTKRKFRLGSESQPFLECKDGNSSYAFREHDKVNFTAVETPSLHNLFEISKNQLLPRVIQFQHTNSENIILKDKELRSALITMLEGPVEVKGFADGEFLLCLTRQQEFETHEAILIPNTLWNTIHLQRRCFPDENAAEVYIAKHFRDLLELVYVDKSLYIMFENQCQVTWLQKKQLSDHTALGVSDTAQNPDEKNKTTGDDITAQLPASKTEKMKSIVQMIKGNAQRGLKKIQEPFLKRTKSTEKKSTRRPKSECYEILYGSDYKSNLSRSVSRDHVEKDEEYTSLVLKPTEKFEADKKLQNMMSDKLTDTTGYSMLRSSNRNTIDKSKQTSKDFYAYTVNELVESFKGCGMDKFAMGCALKKLDGAFFRDFDLNDLKFEPFSLNDFDIDKVRMIIEERCRLNKGMD